jgi:hypothetical protein
LHYCSTFGIITNEPTERDLHPEAPEISRRIRGTTETILNPLCINDRNGSFGGQPIRLSPNIPIEHDVTGNKNPNMSKLFEQLEYRLCVRQSMRIHKFS